VDVEVVVPTTENGTVDAGPWPVMMFVQGGLVDRDRYLWLASHLASRGYATLLPDFPLDLALLTDDDAVSPLRELREHPPKEAPQLGEVTPAAVSGHSLGGVVAAKAWLAAPELYSALGFWASYPDTADDVSAKDGRQVLSLVGSDDGKASESDVKAGAERFGDPTWLGVVDGMNHYGWCDDPTEKELSSDGTASRPVEDARKDALAVIDTFLDASLKQDAEAQQAMADADFSGVTQP
jgi:dienelactone hydrolase